MHAAPRPVLVWSADMSWQACKAVAQLQVPPHPDGVRGGYSSPAVAKSVLWPIAEAARPDGAGVTLSVGTIGRRAQLGRTAVLGGLKLLEWSGIITRRPRFRRDDGGRTSDEIAIAPHVVATPSLVSAPPGPSGERGEVRNAYQGGSPSGPQEPVLEPDLEPEGRAPARPRSKINLQEVPMSSAWEPPEDAYEFGASIGLTTVEVEGETSKFRDWHMARSGFSESADWAATWRLWMRRAVERKAARPTFGHHAAAVPTVRIVEPWAGPTDVRSTVVDALYGDFAKADTWLAKFRWDGDHRALVTTSGTAFSKLEGVRQHLRKADIQIVLERAA